MHVDAVTSIMLKTPSECRGDCRSLSKLYHQNQKLMLKPILGSISTGGRRISHDPFTLCQDLQVLETRRRSEAFQTRRKSEQFQMSSTGRRKSSVFGPLLEQRDNERKSFSMEQM